MWKFCLSALLMFCIGANGAMAVAQSLSETALFHRCYTQITSLRAKDANPLLVEVRAGRKTAVNACIEVLQSARLTGPNNQTLANPSDVVAKSVLATFHRLHASWIYVKDYPVISWPGHNFDIKNLYDASTPALYFTRALFRPGTPATDALTTTDFLRPVRTTMTPATGAASGHALTDYLFNSPFSFAPMGELTGIQPTGTNIVSYPDNSMGPAGTVSLYNTLGGGFLGTNAYFLLNFGGNANGDYKTDGALKMHRLWGKAVYRDVLCRDLPVVRSQDVTALVVGTSSIPFRTSSTCTRCHASHDRMAAAVRGLKIFYIGVGDPTKYGDKSRGGNFPTFHTVSLPAESAWPSVSDPDYYRRPPNGVLFFRNHEGNLVDQPLSSIADLGQKLAATDDYHICLAKRYYAYFTGIDVDTGDLQDPEHYVTSNSEDAKHRQIVITLGKNLKSHQSMIQLIKDILSLPHYKRSDFGTGGGVVTN